MNAFEATGTWRQEIPEWEGELPKTDFVLCDQNGDQVKGTIRRLLPESERFKRWSFEAKIRNRLLLGTYWPRNKEKNPESCGAIFLHAMGDKLLRGILVEFLSAIGEEAYDSAGQVRNMAVQWVKVQTEARRRDDDLASNDLARKREIQGRD